MYDVCNLIKDKCPFCGISYGVYFCGYIKSKDNAIELMKKCPKDKPNKAVNK